MKKAIAILLVSCLLMSGMNVFAASKATEQVYATETFKGELIFPVTEFSGEWKTSTTLTNFNGKEHKWTNQKDASFTVPLKKDVSKGNYEVYYWGMAHQYDVLQTQYDIYHNGKVSQASIYTKLNEGESITPGWVSLGVYDFAGQGDEKLTHQNPGANTRATAVKLVPTTKEITVSVASQEEPKAEQKEEKKSEELDASKNANLGMKIDAALSGVFEPSAGWQKSSKLTGPMTQSAFTLWIAGAGEEAYCKYDPEIHAVGNVRISVYLLYWNENQTTDVKYEVHHNGKVDEFHFDMTKLTEDKWETLGSFDFSGKGDEYVRLVATGEGNNKTNTRASVVAFEIINDADGGVWQTKYVGPNDKSEQAATIKTQEDFLASVEEMLDAFDDTKDHWASYEIGYMANEGLVSGVAERRFDPEATITRAEFVTILDRAMKYEPTDAPSFDDVAQSEWYYPYVGAAKKNGLLKDFPVAEGFKPNQPITREEMALVIYNAVKASGKNDEWVKSLPTDYANFTDTNTVSDYAKNALEYLIQTGIIRGTSKTTVSPAETATRAQAAVILKRFMSSFVWAGPPTDEEWVLTFHDEFLGDSVNWDVWVSDASAPGHILSSRWPENAEVKDGAVHLLTKKEERAGKEWTTGNIWVNPAVFRQAYGYWEARYKFTAHTGINNSFWAITTNGKFASKTEDNFELDICEGHYPNKVNTNYHSWYTGQRLQHSEQYKSEYDLSADYHTYALEWNEDELIYYFDGKVISTKKNENASIPLYPVLSSAVLNWAGSITDAADGTAQIVDYVRIWQRPQDVDNKERTMINAGEEALKPPAGAEGEPESITVASQQMDNKTYPGEIIIPCVVDENWKTSTAIDNYNGKEHYWTNVSGAKSEYRIEGVPAGTYKVYFWRLPHLHNIGQMNILLTQDGKDSPAGSVALQLGENEQAEAGWVEIGTHKLTGDKNALFSYTCVGVNCRASAIKLVPVQ